MKVYVRASQEEEISDALLHMGPLKAPRPDDFPAMFFQQNWATLKAYVIRGVRDFFDHEFLKDYRPISLCNVIYKIISKCLVNRLRPLLDDLIAPTQSAFIPGRLITDNALITFECLHAIKHGSKESKDFGAYKLDLTKAYNHVDWGFLEGVLRWLGFQSKWIRWIMECITTVRYSVHFNNVNLEPFCPTRGLRQGDLLSPYLFLFVANGLSKLLQQEVARGV
jgi:hypothetical protein